ncbi:MAG: acyltransferase [Clostridia bacterium]|nr:acyltransferase [Clostridia bacterium]
MRTIVQKLFHIEISSNLSTTSLLKISFTYFLDLIRGFFRFLKPKVFVSKKVTLFETRKIHFGKWLKLSKGVSLNALSAPDGFGIAFGDHCSVGQNTRIECSGSLSFLGIGFKCGNNCGLGTDSFYGCAGGIEIGNDVIVGNFVSMHSENHNYSNAEVPIRLQGVNHKGIKIGNNCWIGAKVTILDGTVMGDGCIVAAGAVVTGTFPNNVIIGGVPAKVIKERF